MHSIHSTLSEYHPASRHFQAQYRLSVSIGAAAVLINLFFVLLIPHDAGPLYWFFCGFCAGMLLILIGSYYMKPSSPSAGPLEKRLHPSFDRWFPMLQFWFRHLFVGMVFAGVWMQVVKQGMPTNPAHQISILMLFLYAPIRTLIREQALKKSNRRWEIIDEVNGLIMIVILFVFIGLTLSVFVMPEREVSSPRIDQGPLFTSIGVWVVIALVILSRFILLLDRIRK